MYGHISYISFFDFCKKYLLMLIEQPPKLYRLLFHNAIWRKTIDGQKTVYLTFDDGPIPEITPCVLDLLHSYNIKATFFCVGDNVRKYPEVYQDILRRGHRVGNHTFNHVQGWKFRTGTFLANVQKASELIRSNLVRPPHGHMRLPQNGALMCSGYQVVMWDVVTRDYNKKLTPEHVLDNVKNYVRDGSVIVFHDSLKAERNLKYALPRAIDWLLSQRYCFETLP
jgi:peptidoglycan/xylan/chitin deacetylase (PgdA/CDA1 family)